MFNATFLRERELNWLVVRKFYSRGLCESPDGLTLLPWMSQNLVLRRSPAFEAVKYAPTIARREAQNNTAEQGSGGGLGLLYVIYYEGSPGSSTLRSDVSCKSNAPL